MKIETEFDIGDLVYVLKYEKSEQECPTCKHVKPMAGVPKRVIVGPVLINGVYPQAEAANALRPKSYNKDESYRVEEDSIRYLLYHIFRTKKEATEELCKSS